MNDRTKKIALALTGAVTLASGAYAAGTQTGGGNAAAHPQPRAAQPFRGDLADRLGVSEQALENAMRDVKTTLAPQRVNFAEQLAGALNLPMDRVRDALDKRMPKLAGPPPILVPGHPGRGMAFRDDLATTLGVDRDKLRTALEKVRPQAEDFFATKLAEELGIDKSKVQDALKDAGPIRKPLPVPAPRGAMTAPPPPLGDADLAKDLGVTQDELKTAMQQVRKQAESSMRQAHDEFAAALAKALDLDVQTVKDALEPKHP